jgi:hypothetical protein
MKGLQIPNFVDGDFAEWRKKFDCVALAKEWKETDKERYLPLFLEGNAFNLHNSLIEAKHPYAKVIQQLETTFCHGRAELLRNFQESKLSPGNSAQLYLLGLREMCKKCYPDFQAKERETLIYDKFVNSIPQQFVSHIISNPSLNDSDSIADVVDKLIAASDSNSSCHVVHHDKDQDKLKSMQEALVQLQKKVDLMSLNNEKRVYSSARTNSAIRCFQCGGLGHIARWCQGNARGMPRGSNGRL